MQGAYVAKFLASQEWLRMPAPQMQAEIEGIQADNAVDANLDFAEPAAPARNGTAGTAGNEHIEMQILPRRAIASEAGNAEASSQIEAKDEHKFVEGGSSASFIQDMARCSICT